MCTREGDESYLRQIPEDIRKYKAGKDRLIFGYTSDLDVIIEWDKAVINKIISVYLREEPSIKECESIDSMETFARIISYYMIHGLGGEIEITNGEVVETLEEQFRSHCALGGTCAQAACALGMMGFPSIVHITDRSKEVSHLMDGLGIEVTDLSGKRPIAEGSCGEPPVKHLILQYPKGARIAVLGKEYVTSISNRIILDYDKIHKYVPIETGFLEYCEGHADDVLAYSCSGFNGIIDPAIMTGLAEKLSRHYRKIKKLNPNCIIYLESAHYMSAEVNNIVYERLAGSIDLLGMNEEELTGYAQKHGMRVNTDEISLIPEILEIVLERYSLRGIVLHTKDYALYYGDPIGNVDFSRGLALGNLMAGTRARIGRYGNYEECRGTLQLPMSPIGIAYREQLEKIPSHHLVCLVPSRYMEHPVYTIGLGDTFVAGFMIAFIN